MRKQQQIWLHEHMSKDTLPTMANLEPSSAVVYFTEFLNHQKLNFDTVTAVDIGAGKGRNSIYLSTLGCEVYALEYILPAIESAQSLATDRRVLSKIHFELTEIDRSWKFEDSFFDIAIDSFSSIDIETKEGREICRNEMLRTLKPGGYAFVSVVSADDEWEKELIAQSPGPEPNSTIWPQNGKFQKDYDEAELREFYNDFEIIELKKNSKSTFKLGREGTATNFWLILRKK